MERSETLSGPGAEGSRGDAYVRVKPLFWGSWRRRAATPGIASGLSAIHGAFSRARPAERVRTWLAQWRGLLVAMFAGRLVVGIALFVGSTVGAGSIGRELQHWDAMWYLQIASGGYPRNMALQFGSGNALAFFPLFPEIMKLLHVALDVPLLQAGFLLNVIAELFALGGMRRLAEGVSPGTGVRAAVLLAAFPGSAVFALDYPEALALCLCIWSLLMALRERWVVASVLGFFACMTHVNSLGLAFAFLVVALNRRHRGEWWRPAAAVVAAASGAVGFWAWEDVRTHTAFVWWRVEHLYWQPKLDGQLGILSILLQHNSPWGSFGYAVSAAIGSLLVILALRAACGRRWPPVLVAFVAAQLIVCLASSKVALRPRYLLLCFPLLIPVALKFRGVEATLLTACGFVLTIPLMFAWFLPGGFYP